MSRLFEVARPVLKHHGGTVEKFIGDAVMAVFGNPCGVVHAPPPPSPGTGGRPRVEPRARPGRPGVSLDAPASRDVSSP
jgi:hypothetical protein